MKKTEQKARLDYCKEYRFKFHLLYLLYKFEVDKTDNSLAAKLFDTQTT